MDLEQKSEKVLDVFTTMLVNILKQPEYVSIETPSFFLNHFVLNTSSIQKSYVLKKSRIQIPSFCELTNNILNCSQQTIILKVY